MIYWIASGVTLLYCCVLLLLLFAWHSRKPIVAHSAAYADLFASIIIPVRNEARNIERLIRSISKGSIDDSKFEIIVIDDHSEDQTKTILESLVNEIETLSYAPLPNGQTGKKAAIAFGVSLAKGDLIVCTDGDSEVAEGWLNEYKKAYSSGAKMAFGPVKLFNEAKTRWIDLLNLELAALVGVGAATLKMGRPTMINGCNYSFSKELFLEVGAFEGNDHIASGDDEFLLRKIYRQDPDKVQFLKTHNALVVSEPPVNGNAFYHQRRRWASKWKLHQDLFSMIVPVFIFCIYSVLSWLVIDMILTANAIGFYVFAAKLMVDFLFVHQVSKVQERKVSVVSFILLQIIYPFYVVFFGVASNFGTYRWRERIHKI